MVVATGWGFIPFGRPINALQKVTYEYVSFTNCKNHYTQNRRLNSGIVNETQVCAGALEGEDICLVNKILNIVFIQYVALSLYVGLCWRSTSSISTIFWMHEHGRGNNLIRSTWLWKQHLR